MEAKSILFSKNDIQKLLQLYAEKIYSDLSRTSKLIVIGGSAMSLLNLRHGTHDIDVMNELTMVERQVIEKISESESVSTEWMNNRSLPFRPQNLNLKSCTLVLRILSTELYIPSFDLLLVMKLHASRGERDLVDMYLLWAHSSFTSIKAIEEAYWDAYPNAPLDPYLNTHLEKIELQSCEYLTRKRTRELSKC